MPFTVGARLPFDVGMLMVDPPPPLLLPLSKGARSDFSSSYQQCNARLGQMALRPRRLAQRNYRSIMEQSK